jgi:NuA3 HAT complex component NTO1
MKNSEKLPREEQSYRDIYEDLDVDEEHELLFSGPKAPRPRNRRMEATDSNGTGNREYKEAAHSSGTGLDAVRYKMDEHDLEIYGRLGAKARVFELVMDRLEKEWFLFRQRLINEHVELLFPDGPCDVCTDATCDDENLLVACQGCGLVVHEDCYGVRNYGEFWLCRECTCSGERAVCCFCGTGDGALKQTADLQWGHVLCALFNKSLFFANPVSREPIDVDGELSAERCIYCHERTGATIGCAYFMCRERYHVACGVGRLYFDLNNRVSYCGKHDPTKRSLRFGSQRMFSLQYLDYEELPLRPKIRRRLELQRREDTLFLKITKMKPKMLESVASRISICDLGDGNAGETVMRIYEYWMAKRNALGTALFVFSEFGLGNETGEEWHRERCRKVSHG